MVFPASFLFTVINLCFAGIVEAKPMQEDSDVALSDVITDEMGHRGNILAQLAGKKTFAFHVVEQQQQQQQHQQHHQQQHPQGLLQRVEEHVQFVQDGVPGGNMENRPLEGKTVEARGNHGSHDSNHPTPCLTCGQEGSKAGVGGQDSGFQAGDVEEMVHGRRNVHGHAAEEKEEIQGERTQALAGSVEQLMHGGADVHSGGAGDSTSGRAHGADDPKGEFKAGDAEEMVHGASHVHGRDAAATSLPYGPAGDVEKLVHGSAGGSHANVHDPASRHEAARTLAMAADVKALMGTVGGGDAERKRQHGNAPTVLDGEHLMHGGGGHDHDVRQLKFIKSKEEKEEEDEAKRKARDAFADLHALLMHGDDHHDDDDVRRGKEITYKDIMALGLDESMLRGVDLKQLLLKNAREYDDWQRDQHAAPGELAEASWWDQIKDLRRRYLPPFPGGKDKPKDLTGTQLDPENQKWIAGKGVEDDDENGNEDHILHQLEVLGSTAPLKDRHKHARKKFVENGRDLTDL